MAACSGQISLRQGARLSVNDGVLRLTVPWLFGARSLEVPGREVAACRADEYDDAHETPRGQPHPLQIAMLVPTRRYRRPPPNLMIVFAHPLKVPKVRVMARIHPVGLIFHSARHQPVDGFLFSAKDPAAAMALFTREGINDTITPATWVADRRSGAFPQEQVD